MEILKENSMQPKQQGHTKPVTQMKDAKNQLLFKKVEKPLKIGNDFTPENDVSLYLGDCLDFLQEIPDGAADLVVTSPPYNIGKEYEKKLDLSVYLEQQKAVIKECIRILSDQGSICWQVGNYVNKGEIIPFRFLIKKHGVIKPCLT